MRFLDIKYIVHLFLICRKYMQNTRYTQFKKHEEISVEYIYLPFT